MPLPLSTIAVLTGDLMQSTRADPTATEQAMQDLARAAAEVAGWIGADTRLTRFRGDGWQIVLTRRPDLALRASLLLFATLKARKQGLRTRVAVATGPADHLGTQNLSDARGAAFTLSGRTLDAMKPHILRMEFEGVRPLHRGFIDLLEPLIGRWTPEQAEAVRHAIHPDSPPQKAIAHILNITEQAVSYRLRGAHDHALHQALKGWEDDLTQHEARHA